jgi:hypothetical protein
LSVLPHYYLDIDIHFSEPRFYKRSLFIGY